VKSAQLNGCFPTLKNCGAPWVKCKESVNPHAVQADKKKNNRIEIFSLPTGETNRNKKAPRLGAFVFIHHSKP
jgi:hypothetical protein